MRSKIFDIFLFICLAVPGALLFVFSCFFLIAQFFEPKQDLIFIYPITLSLVGAIVTLIGIKKIKQWLFIIVFASIPFSIFIAWEIGKYVVVIHPGLLFPVIGLLAFAIPYNLNKVIKNYYENKRIE
jgi:hypothetical protein